MAVPGYDQGHITVPAAEAYSSGGADCYKVPVPMVDGTDISDYQKIPRSVDYFFHIPEEEPKYIVNVNRDGKGTFSIFEKDCREENYSPGEIIRHLIIGRNSDERCGTLCRNPGRTWKDTVWLYSYGTAYRVGMDGMLRTGTFGGIIGRGFCTVI